MDEITHVLAPHAHIDRGAGLLVLASPVQITDADCTASADRVDRMVVVRIVAGVYTVGNEDSLNIFELAGLRYHSPPPALGLAATSWREPPL